MIHFEPEFKAETLSDERRLSSWPSGQFCRSVHQPELSCNYSDVSDSLVVGSEVTPAMFAGSISYHEMSRSNPLTFQLRLFVALSALDRLQCSSTDRLTLTARRPAVDDILERRPSNDPAFPRVISVSPSLSLPLRPFARLSVYRPPLSLFTQRVVRHAPKYSLSPSPFYVFHLSHPANECNNRF